MTTHSNGNTARRAVMGIGGIFLLAVLPLLGADSGAPSSARVPNPLSLDVAFSLALQHNPEIHAATLAARAEHARILAAKGQFDTRLFVDSGWSESERPSDTRGGHSERDGNGHLAAGARKRFHTGTEAELATAVDYTDDINSGAGISPVFDSALRLVLRQDLLRDAGRDINQTDILIAEDRWDITRQNLRSATMQTLFNLESAYWSLHYAMSDLAVRRAQLDRATRLVEVAESQVRVGEAAPIEITRARSSAAAQEVAILDAQNRISLQKNRLLRLLGVADPAAMEDEIRLGDEPAAPIATGSLQDSLAIAWERRPDCRNADLLLRIAELRERQTRNQTLPSLQLYGGVGLAGKDEEAAASGRDLAQAEYPAWEVGMAFEIPIPNRTAKGTYRAAALERQQAATLKQAALQQALREVADALDEVTTVAKQIDRARQSRELAGELLAAEEKSFRLGRSDSLDVLNAQAALATAERDEIRAKTAYATSLAFLYVVRGDLLEQKKLPLAD